MEAMRILLINPPFTQNRRNRKRCVVPLGLASIGATLETNGFTVKILDCVVEGYAIEQSVDEHRFTYGLPDGEVAQRIKRYNPDIVGVSSILSLQAHNAHRVCRIVKSVNDAMTVMGGAHASATTEATLSDPNVDKVVVGEGELAMLDIARGNGESAVSAPISPKDLPVPAWHLLPIEKYLRINMPENTLSPNKRVLQVESSRGCPFNCYFCSSKRFWGSWRAKPPSRVLDEIRMLKEAYDIDEVNFTDPNFSVNRRHMIEVLNGLCEIDVKWAVPGGMWVGGLDERILDLMKKSGCYQLTFAVENVNPHILEFAINKPLDHDRAKSLARYCHRIGIDTHAFFITGFPEESRRDIWRNYDYARECNFSSASFNLPTPMPGSPLFDMYPSMDYLNAEYRRPSIPHPELTAEELERLIDTLNRRFNKSLLWRSPIRFAKKYGRNPRKAFFGRQ